MARNVINCIFAFIVFSMWSVLVDVTTGTRWSDFPAYYTTAMQVKLGRAELVYDIDVQRAERLKYFPEGEGLAFEPPYALPMITFITLLPPWPAKILWDGLLAAALSVGCVVLAKVAALSGRQTLLLIGCTALSGSAFEILKVSKPAAFLFCSMALSLYCIQRRRDRLAGLGMLLFSWKPQQLLGWFVYAFGACRWQYILVSGLVALAVLAITFPFVGKAAYPAYQHLVTYLIMEHPEIPGMSGMPTFKGQLMRLSLPNTTCILISNIGYGIALLSLAAFGWRNRKRNDWWKSGLMLSFTLGAAACPYMHLYDHILVVPAVVFLLLRLAELKRKDLIIVTWCCIATFLQPLYAFFLYYYLHGLNSIVNVHFVALGILAGIAIWSEFQPKAEEVEG